MADLALRAGADSSDLLGLSGLFGVVGVGQSCSGPVGYKAVAHSLLFDTLGAKSIQ